MKDNELQFDRSCHVLYSKPCRREIQQKIALHYPEAEREAVWEQVQRQYADYLAGWRTDLGGKKNFHNGAGGHLRLYRHHELLHRVQRCHFLPGDRGDGGKPDPAVVPQAEIRRLQ